MTKTHAFHVLLPQQEVALRRRALKLSSNPHRAEDLVQATMLKAWANRDRFKPDSNLRAWLFTILRNTFFSELRKYRLEVEDVDDAAARSLFEPPRQEDTVALKELLAAMDELPVTQRQPMLLTGAFGYSQLEASDACGCTVGTIKSRVSRGRAALSRVLGQDEIMLAVQGPGNLPLACRRGQTPTYATTRSGVAGNRTSARGQHATG